MFLPASTSGTCADGTWEFGFRVADHEVTIESDGRSFVDGVLARENAPVDGPA